MLQTCDARPLCGCRTLGLYPLLSLVNQSCCPNSCYILDIAFLRAARDLKKGQHVCIAQCPHNSGLEHALCMHICLSAVLWTASLRQICMHVRQIPSTEGVALNCDYASLAQTRFLLQKDCCWVGVSPFSDTTFMSDRCNTDTQST